MPVRIDYRPPPKHWGYLLSRKAVKSLASELDADLRLVQYEGTCRKPTGFTKWYGATRLDARVVETGWCYRLRLWSLPDPVVGGEASKMGALVRADIIAFVRAREKEVVDVTATTPLVRRHYFEDVDGGLRPIFRTSEDEGTLEAFSQYDPWWTLADG